MQERRSWASCGPQRNAWAEGAALGGLALVWAWHASFLQRSRWWAVPVAIALGAALPAMARGARQLVSVNWAWLSAVGAAGAGYLCVPENDQYRPLIVVLVVVVILQRVAGPRSFVGLWTVAMAAVLGAGLFGATGRQSALIGALFAVAVTGLFAVVVRVRPSFTPTTFARWVMGVLPTAAAAVVARTGALSRSPGPAVAAVALTSLGLLVVTAAVVRVGADRDERA